MQEMGLEPTRPCEHRHLKPARLPIPPLLRTIGYVTIDKENCQEGIFFFSCVYESFVVEYYGMISYLYGGRKHEQVKENHQRAGNS